MKKSKKKRKKPNLDEIISFALYADNAKLYSITYRDFDTLVETSLENFLEKNEIPRHRIVLVKKKDKILYVKHNCCPKCGSSLKKENNEKICINCGYLIHLT